MSAPDPESVWKWISGSLLAILIFFAGTNFGTSAYAEELKAHEALPGHPVGMEKLETIIGLMKDISQRLANVEKVQTQILIELRETDRQAK